MRKDGGDSMQSFLDDLQTVDDQAVEWVDAGTTEQVAAAGLRCLRIQGRPVGVVQAPDGNFVARELTCKHHGADLSAGPRQGTVVTCPRHGWEYDLVSGQCITDPSLPLRAYATKIEEGHLWVSSRLI